MYWKKAGTTNLLTLDMSGNLTATGNVTAYSDRRIKENITPITEALSKVQRLTGNTYTRNDQEDTATKYAGLIAQEVEDVLPEAVREADDGIKVLDYNATIALLVESIKELKAEVDDLKSQLENK
jgi:tetrahydromethanopterin S-methyltransferase subunit B